MLLIAASDYSPSYKRWLSSEDRQRRDRRIPRCALRKWNFSSFRYLYISGNNQALINATGHDHTSFRKLLRLFSDLYIYWTWDLKTNMIRPKILDVNGYPCGRQRDLSPIGCLGLILMWYRTNGSCTRNLSMMFGQTSTVLYKWLIFGRCVLLHVLSAYAPAKVCLPTAEEVIELKSAVVQKYPTCKDVVGAADGLKLLVEAPINWKKQEKFFNGWKQAHYINCVFLFTVDGKIRVAIINAPGSFHDSTIADYGAYSKFERLYELHRAKIVVDSAFQIERGPWMIQSSQLDPEDTEEIILNREATSVRQLSEWGMRMIQASSPRLKQALPCDEDGEREIILRLMLHLHNFAAETMGLNQIFNSFMTNDMSYYSYEGIDEFYNANL